MLEAVFFDVGNTLLYPFPSVSEVCRQVLAQAGHVRDLASIDELIPLVDQYYEDRYREDDTFWTDEAETSAVWVGMYGLLCRRLGIAEDAEKLARRVYEEFGAAGRWHPYDDVVRTFARLTERGLRIGIVSNWDSRLGALVSGLGLDAFVTEVLSSADVGLRKPDPRIFELACERLDVAPTRAAHVGDHYYADIVGARAIGMKAVLIDRHAGETPEYRPFIRTLDELDAVLEMESEG